MSLAYLSYGSNLGDRQRNIDYGIDEVGKRGIGTVLRRSRMYETAPVGTEKGGDFLNCVVELMTDAEPHVLLQEIRDIEEDGGRKRTKDKYAPRTIDIDILLYDCVVINDTGLTLPHPEIAKRMFILKPLNDIRPDFRHPSLGKTVSELLSQAPADVAGQRIRVL